MSDNRSIASAHPRRWDVPLLAVVALVILGFGVFLPALEFESWFGDDAFSVLGGIGGFLESGNLLLAVLLFSFSIVFPAAKLATVCWLWFAPLPVGRRREVLEWLELLGKWSLLDSFVIAVTIGTVQLGILSEAVARPGVYVYLGAIVLSLIATFRLRPFIETGSKPPRPKLRRVGLWLTLPGAVLYGAGLSLPLMEVEKGWFWENRYSVLDGTWEMFRVEEYVLGTAVLLFVIALPTVRFLGVIALRLAPRAHERWTRALAILDKWSMAEVFALSLLVVFTKVGSLAEATPRAGLWCLFGAAVLTAVDSILFLKAARGDPDGA